MSTQNFFKYTAYQKVKIILLKFRIKTRFRWLKKPDSYKFKIFFKNFYNKSKLWKSKQIKKYSGKISEFYK